MIGKKLRLIDVILLNVVVVTSLRWIASAGAHGFGSLILWILAGLCFFLPLGFAVSSLAAEHPEQGGIYRWTAKALGPKHGFLCGWCYWVNNLLYFPALMMFVAGNVSVLIQNKNANWYLQHEKTFVFCFTICLLWLIAGLSIFGIRVGRWLQDIGGFANWLPALMIAILGFVSLALYGSPNPLNFKLAAADNSWERFSLFAQMCFAFSGLELVSLFQTEIEHSQRTIRLGIVIAGLLITAAYLVGTLGILFAAPLEKMNAMNGLLVAIQESSARFGMGWLAPLGAFLLALGGIGAAYAWFSGSAKIPYLVGVDTYLPRSFSKLHPKYETPVTAILWQTVLATALTIFATAGSQSRMETSYRILVDMCLLLYFIPYLYLFLSAQLLKTSFPGGMLGRVLILSSGFLATLLAIFTSLNPAEVIANGFLPGKTILGAAAMIAVGFLLYWRVPCQD